MALLENQADLVLAKDSVILVTGANGYVASNLITEALAAGYRVRGAVRSADKADASRQLFASGGARYEAVVVPDITQPGAFDDAVRGVGAVVHVATPAAYIADPNLMIGPAVAAATGIMRSALAEPRVRSFVYTSSSLSVSDAAPNTKGRITTDTWNHAIVDRWADNPPPYRPEDWMYVYGASKMLAEQAVWKFAREEEPHYVVNTVLPNFIMGRVVGPAGFTVSVMRNAYDGDVAWYMPAQYMVNVVDVARIHLAAAIDGSVASERILAYAYPWNFNDVLDIFRELRPGKKVPEKKPDVGVEQREVDNQRGAELLKKWYGQDGYTSLKESVRQTIEGQE